MQPMYALKLNLVINILFDIIYNIIDNISPLLHLREEDNVF